MTPEELKTALREYDEEKRMAEAEADEGGGCCGTFLMAGAIFFIMLMFGFC